MALAGSLPGYPLVKDGALEGVKMTCGVEDLHELTYAGAVEAAHVALSRSMLADASDSDPAAGGCKQCVIEETTTILKKAFGHIDSWCGEKGFEGELAHGCDSKKCWFCKAWKNDPLVMHGVVMEKLHPLVQGYRFCQGAKSCTGGGWDALLNGLEVSDFDSGFHLSTEAAPLFHVEEAMRNRTAWWKKSVRSSEASSSSDDSSSSSDETSKSSSSDEFWHPGQKVQAEPLEVTLARSLGEAPPPPPAWDEHRGEGFFARMGHWIASWFHHGPPKGQGKGHDGAEVNGVCVKCYKRTFEAVMKFAVGATKKMCMSTKCPFLHKWCGWAAKHPKVAYGQIMGHVEPWKFAIGRCWHRGGAGPKGKGKGFKPAADYAGGKGSGKGAPVSMGFPDSPEKEMLFA